MELSILALIVWGEITFLLAGGLILLLLNNVIKQRKGRQSINGLFEKLKTDRTGRLEQIRAGLSEYGLQGDALEEKVKEIDLQERKLYQRIATMYKNRSDGMLSRINVAMETATRPYYELGIKLSAADSQDVTGDGAAHIDDAEIEKLREENKHLQDELSVTMDTIGRMLSEYSSMFGTEDESGLDKSKIMQAFNVDEDGEQVDAIEDVTESEAAADEERLQEEELEVGLGLDDDIEIGAGDEDVDDLMGSNDQEISPGVDKDEVTPDIDAILADAESASNDVVETDELLEIEDEMPEPEQDDELDIVLDEGADETVSVVDVEVSDEELLEIDDELPVQVTDDDLDVVIDDEIPDLDAIISEADEALSGNTATDKDPLQETVALNDNDVADLEAAGLTGIVDLESDLGDELIELADGLDFDDLESAKKEDENSEEVADIDDLDIDQLLDSNKNS